MSSQAREWNSPAELWARQNQNIGINSSGLLPLGHAVLVKPYEPERVSSVIEIPDSVRATMQQVDQRAIVIAVGPEAWKGEALPRAVPGDKVLVAKYEGYFAGPGQTKDGQMYRIVNDSSIFTKIDWESGT